MHAAEHILAVPDITFYKSNMVLAGNIVHIAVDLKVSVLGRHVRAGLLHHMFFMDTAVILQLLDRDEFQSVLLRQLPQVCGPHHGSVLFHDLTAHAAFGQSRQTHEIHRRLRVPVSHKDAAAPCNQRKHMARSSEILRFRRRIHALHHRIGTLCRGDPCRCVRMVDGDRKCSTVVVRVLRYHLRESQPLRHCCAHRRTDQPFRMARHKIDIFLRRKLCRANHVPFVFPVRIIRDKNDLSRPQIFKRFLDRIVLFVHISRLSEILRFLCFVQSHLMIHGQSLFAIRFHHLSALVRIRISEEIPC